MKKNIYPDWVEKYRSKGHTIKKVKAGYALYSCTSVYVKGQNPKSVQTYLGMIDQYKGFIPKTVAVVHPVYLEFGLSHFILTNYKRKLQRTTFSNDLRVVYLGIILFIFGEVNDFFLRACALTFAQAGTYLDDFHQISAARISSCRNKIEKLLQAAFPNEKELNLLIQGLKLCVVEKNSVSKAPNPLPETLQSLIEKAGCRYD